MTEYYNTWEVCKIKDGIFKGTKNGMTIMASSAKLLKAMINENEGTLERDNSIERMAKRENKGSEQSDLMMRKAFEKLKKKVDHDDF